MRAVKVVQQYYTAEPEILCMLEQFRQMLNDCVRIGLSENVTAPSHSPRKLIMNLQPAISRVTTSFARSVKPPEQNHEKARLRAIES